MLDLELMRLQYEILNKSIAQIASDEETSATLLQREATELGWKQFWPDPPQKPYEETDDVDEIMSLESEQYIDRARKRLKVYSLAKEVLMAQRYLALECKIVKTASDILDNFESNGLGSSQAIKQLSALFKDMTAGSNLANLASMTLGTDDNGLPTVTIRDLSGHR